MRFVDVQTEISGHHIWILQAVRTNEQILLALQVICLSLFSSPLPQLSVMPLLDLTLQTPRTNGSQQGRSGSRMQPSESLNNAQLRIVSEERVLIDRSFTSQDPSLPLQAFSASDVPFFLTVPFDNRSPRCNLQHLDGDD